MATRRLRPSLVSLSVVLILVVVSVVGFGLTRRNNDQQEQALLQSNTSQAAAYASEIFSGLATSLSSVACRVHKLDFTPGRMISTYQMLDTVRSSGAYTASGWPTEAALARADAPVTS